MKVVTRKMPSEVIYMVFNNQLYLNETLSSSQKAEIISQISQAGSEHRYAGQIQRG